ncbi:MAG: hypothetical protein DHS20C13_21410 [Thermodesulfobacteriota bacterium]|nr:MAG: hypothetical protein DHS20C13_21410 [Thermodesulfobacteriota bacterium]
MELKINISINSLEEQKEYWHSKLSGVLPVTEIPSEYRRPPVQSFLLEEETIDLDEKILNGLTILSEKEEVSLFTLLLSLYNATLMRYTSTHDIITGSISTDSLLEDSEEKTYTNPIALRMDIDNNSSFSELFKKTSKIVNEAIINKNYPFTEILKDAGNENQTSRAPIFQNMFVVCNIPDSLSQDPISEDDISEIEEFSIRCDTVLILSIENDHIKIKYNYDSDLFSSQSAKQFISHFQVVIESALQNPESCICDFSLLTNEELKLITEIWNSNNKDYGNVQSIQRLFEEQAKSTPDTIAVSFEGQNITYEELNSRSNQVAHYLRSLGTGPEVKVGLGLDNSIELIINILGILKSGGVYVPLDLSYPENRLNYIISQSNTRFIISKKSLLEKFDFHDKVHFIYLDAKSNEIENFETENPVDLVEANNIAYVIYTSGSTGKPKGVSITHKGIANRLLWGEDISKLSKEDRFLQSASISFDASIWQIFAPLTTGACLILSSSENYQDPEYLAETISRENVTFADFVPTMLRLVTEKSKELNNALRCVTCGGESLQPSVRDSFFSHFKSAELHNCYGPTETSIDATCWVCDKNSANISIGRPISNSTAYIVDDGLNPVPIHVAAELFIGGIGLAREYINRPDLTAESFIPNPFSENPGSRIYKTGDLARYSLDGNLEFLGRLDNQVNIGGYRIELDEISNVISEHPDIADVVVTTKSIKQIKDISDSNTNNSAEITNQLEIMDKAIALDILGEVERMSEDEAQKICQELSGANIEGGTTLKRKTSDFEITLEIKTPEFINPPQENQRNWTLQRSVDEFVDDLINLDTVTKRFVTGSERVQIEDNWDKSKAEFNDSQLVIEGQQVMQDWERPLMKAMAEIVTEAHGDVLEVGFGMGISSTFIQEFGVKSHTIIECNEEVVESFNKWKEQYPENDIRLVFGQWQDVTDQLESYDGVFFDTYPLSEEEFIEYAIKDITFAEHFFSTAAGHLRDGGIFTYYTNEIDSFSRRHQRLLLKYFKSYTLSKVESLRPPEDCNYWWADSMMTVKAIK